MSRPRLFPGVFPAPGLGLKPWPGFSIPATGNLIDTAHTVLLTPCPADSQWNSRAVSLISLLRSRSSGPYAEALGELYDVIALDQSVRIPGTIERVAAARKAEELV